MSTPFETTYDTPDPMLGVTGSETDLSEKVENWFNIGNNGLNLVSGFLSVFNQSDLEDQQKQYAFQQQVYEYQRTEDQKRTNILIGSAVACVFAVLITVYLTKRS